MQIADIQDLLYKNNQDYLIDVEFPPLANSLSNSDECTFKGQCEWRRAS